MKYNEFIHLNENFNPVFDLENENELDWSLFIPNNKFRDVLSSVIDSMDNSKTKNPVWLSGTYGTGKSHATSVIKHCLCDEEITDFDLNDKQLTSKLKTFRENTKVFPVIIKGTSNIDNTQRFRSTIQNSVKKSLKLYNMNVTIPSDFEQMIELLKNETIHLKEEDYIGSNIEDYRDEIIPRLENEESKILIGIEEILLNKGLSPFAQEDIVHWLIKIKKELKKNYNIDYLMIFWDEFTGALNLRNVEEILLEIQNIAEAKNKGLSLFIVSHKTRSDLIDFNTEKIEKILDRFERKSYTMEPVATYELMEKSIKKDDEWEEIKNKFIGKVSDLIDKISINNGPKVKKALENLYPIHPYTAYLATFIAQEIGSTDRSIFKFLHDNTSSGFKSFIDTYEINERFFLTAEYLWDFFYETFNRREDEKTIGVIRRYKLHATSLRNKGEEYLIIFKVILLLNILYKIAEVDKGSLAIPSRTNINSVFSGSIYQDKVNYVLNYIDENGIVNESPDSLFELTTNALPQREVKEQERKILNNLTLSVLLDKKMENEIKENISKKVNRAMEIVIKDAKISEAKLKNDLERGIFNKDAYLHMLYFLGKTSEDIENITKILKSINSDYDDLNNIIVLISEASLSKKDLDEYVNFKARAIIAEKHNFGEDVEINNKHADKRIKKWFTNIKSKPVRYYLNGEMNRSEIIPFIKNILNKELSRKIFSKGLENIDSLTKNENLWKPINAKTLADKYMTARNLDDLRDNLSGLESKTIDIFKDNNGEEIIKNNFEFKTNISEKHPIKLMQDFIDNKLENAKKKGNFNLGNVLRELSKSPYGLYPNKINIPALAFILKKYVDELYDDKGLSINESKMKDNVINIFEFWSNNKKEDKLNVRFGSIIEKKLSNLIKEIFNLNLDPNNSSIKNVRWELRKWIKSVKKAPLWLLEYSNNSNSNLNKSIESLSEFLRPTDPSDQISDKSIQKCYNDLEPNSYDFKSLIKEDKCELFKKFILRLNIKIEPNNIQNIINNNIIELMDHIARVMPEEIYDWDKNKVESEIIKWIYEKHYDEIKQEEKEWEKHNIFEENEKLEKEKSDDDKTNQKIRPSSSITKNDYIINEIEKTKPEKIKKLLIKILQENKELQYFFKDYLQ